jgi:DNA-binding MarR family transcriptional regulator
MRLRGAYAWLRRRSNLALMKYGLSSDQYVLLTALAEHGVATQQELVERCYSDTATIGTMVTLLSKKGWVERAPHPEDGRAWSVKIRAPGLALVRRTRRGTMSVRGEMVRLFTEQELRTLSDCLERLAGGTFQSRRRVRSGKSIAAKRAGSSRKSSQSPRPL